MMYFELTTQTGLLILEIGLYVICYWGGAFFVWHGCAELDYWYADYRRVLAIAKAERRRSRMGEKIQSSRQKTT